MTDTVERETPEPRHERILRIAVGVFVFLLVLAMYRHTADPTGDIKRLLLAWAAGLLGAVWLVLAFFGYVSFRRPRLFFEVLLAFLALYLISSFFSEFGWISLIETSSFFLLVMLYFVASQVYHTERQVQHLMIVLCSAVCLASLYGFMQKMGIDPFPWADRAGDVYANVPATFGHPNFAAHTLILTLIMVVFLATTGLGPVWSLLFFWIFLIHLNFTDQRGGIIGLAAAVLLVLVAWRVGRGRGSPLKKAAISLVLVAVIGAAGLGSVMAINKARTGTIYPLDVSLIIRYQSYVSAADMAKEGMVLGHGPGVYGIRYPEHWTTFEQEWFAQELRMNAHVHNDVMEIAIDAGFPAAALYLMLHFLGMGYGLVMAFSAETAVRRRLGYAFAAFFCAFLIDGLFGFNLRVPVSATILFLMMGALEGLWPAAGTRPGPKMQLAGRLARGGALAALVGAVALQTCVFAGEYWEFQGMAAQHRKNLGEARTCYNRGKEFAPWNWDLDRRLGQVSLSAAHFEQALKHLEDSLATNPYYVLTRLPMAHAKMFLAQKKMKEGPGHAEEALTLLDEGVAHVNELLRICPMFPKAHDILGRMASVSAVFLAASGEEKRGPREETYWHTAEEHLLAALQYEIENRGDLYLTLGKVRMALGKVLEAEQSLVHAVQENPADEEAWTVLLDFARHHKRFGRLRNTLAAQIHRLKEEEEPDRNALATTNLLLANVLENGGAPPEDVDAAYLAATEYGPKRPEIWTNFARYAYDRGRMPALRVSVAQTCGQLQALNEAPLAHVAAVNAVLQQGAGALGGASETLLTHVRTYRPTVELSTSQAFGWSARILIETLRTVPPDSPEHCGACLNLGIVYAGFSELEVAEQLFIQAAACLEEDRKPFLAVHWADLLVRQDRLKEALTLLEKSCEKNPGNLDVRWAWARTLVKAGFPQEASEQYEVLLNEPGLDPKGRAMLEKERAVL